MTNVALSLPFRELTIGDVCDALVSHGPTQSVPYGSIDSEALHAVLQRHRDAIFAQRTHLLSHDMDAEGFALLVPHWPFSTLAPGEHMRFMGIRIVLCDVPTIIFGSVPETLR